MLRPDVTARRYPGHLHIDLILFLDGGAATLIGSQYNLVAGTLTRFARNRPDLQPLLKRVMDFDVSSVVSHSANIED